MSECVSSHYLSGPIKKPVSASSMSHYIIFDREEVIRERNKGGREGERQSNYHSISREKKHSLRALSVFVFLGFQGKSFN